MFLNNNDMKKTTAIFLFLKQQGDQYFEDSGISICQRCSGTGLKGVKKLWDNNNNYSWESLEFCSDCRGVGYKDIMSYEENQIDMVNHVCRNCGGNGCVKCGKTGVTDWVSNIMGR